MFGTDQKRATGAVQRGAMIDKLQVSMAQGDKGLHCACEFDTHPVGRYLPCSLLNHPRLFRFSAGRISARWRMKG
jgi:hypothetical protein